MALFIAVVVSCNNSPESTTEEEEEELEQVEQMEKDDQRKLDSMKQELFNK
jgi:hypothetical protein